MVTPLQRLLPKHVIHCNYYFLLFLYVSTRFSLSPDAHTFSKLQPGFSFEVLDNTHRLSSSWQSWNWTSKDSREIDILFVADLSADGSGDVTPHSQEASERVKLFLLLMNTEHTLLDQQFLMHQPVLCIREKYKVHLISEYKEARKESSSSESNSNDSYLKNGWMRPKKRWSKRL